MIERVLDLQCLRLLFDTLRRVALLEHERHVEYLCPHRVALLAEIHAALTTHEPCTIYMVLASADRAPCVVILHMHKRSLNIGAQQHAAVSVSPRACLVVKK